MGRVVKEFRVIVHSVPVYEHESAHSAVVRAGANQRRRRQDCSALWKQFRTGLTALFTASPLYNFVLRWKVSGQWGSSSVLFSKVHLQPAPGAARRCT